VTYDNERATGAPEFGGADPVELFRLDGRVAVVTGASSGLGAHIARVLTAAGARVALAARREGPLKELAGQLPGALAVPCDVTLAQDRERLVRTVAEELGPVDVLVNNAGLSETVPAEAQSVEAFQSILAVNLTAVFALSTAVGAGMLERGRGSIVNIASIYGLVASGSLPQAAYQLQVDLMLRAGVRLTNEATTFGMEDASGPYQQWAQIMEGYLREAADTGELQAGVDVRELAEYVVESCTGMQLYSKAVSGREDLMDRVVRMWRLLLPGIAVPAVAVRTRVDPTRVLPAPAEAAAH
jgi:NAD(P)-dependent dehydrogenase (short-subunit alcohol dehydrogenase family)